MAASGKRTALVERRYIGGSCPNIACLPSKNIIHTAKVAHLASQSAAFGLHPGIPGVDMRALRDRKRRMVDGLIATHEDRFHQTGTDFILGEGRFTAPRTLEVTLADANRRALTADVIFLSTGSRATLSAEPGLANSQPLTHIEALELDQVPEHLVILGGGYVGLEFAQAMRRFGCRVTIVERSKRLLPREDPDVADALTAVLLAEDIHIFTEATLTHVEGRSGEHVTLHLTQYGSPAELSGSHLLVATGRTPNTDNLGLEIAGVAPTSSGYIQVDEHLRTTAPGIFAVGDCAGSPKFTHIAYDDFRIVRETLAGRPRSILARQVPSCLFTDPELARVGLNEIEARERSLPYRLLKLPMRSVLRTRTTGEETGLLKALLSPDDDTILGFTGLGASAGEIMAPVQVAMSASLPYTALRDCIFTHPTFCEGLVYLFSSTPVLIFPGQHTPSA